MTAHSRQRLLAFSAATFLTIFAAAGDLVTEAARPVPTYGAIDGGASVLLSNADSRSPYGGIVRYFGRAQCSGVFVATVRDDDDPRDAPAYVLTNGHCPVFPAANEVIVNREAPSTHRVVFNYFADATTQQVSVRVARIAYATMKGQDLAVLELDARYDEIVRRGFMPWPFTLVLPAREESVAVVGAPLTGETGTAFLRLAACRLESRAAVVLEYIWHWFDFDRNRCADVRPGSSGSAVISRQTGHLLGLVSTTTSGAVPFTECFLNHPCEPALGDVTSRATTSYMTPLVRVDRCFDEGGRFALAQRGCPLDQGLQLMVSPSFLGAENPRRPPGLVGAPRERWSVALSGQYDHYRYKVVAASSGDCRDLRGYGPSLRVVDHPVIDDPLPQEEGFQFLCVIGGVGTRWGDSWQSLDHPTVVVVQIDSIPPRIPAPITVVDSDSNWVVEFRTLEPEISGYLYKFGRPSETRCEDAANYRPALIPFISLPKANRPYVFCAIPLDSALNPGTTFEALLP